MSCSDFHRKLIFFWPLLSNRKYIKLKFKIRGKKHIVQIIPTQVGLENVYASVSIHHRYTEDGS